MLKSTNNYMNLNHQKIAIEYLNIENEINKPFLVCADCPWYDKDNKILLPYDEKIAKELIDQELVEHNEKINEVWTKTYLEVRENSVIKHKIKFDLWAVFYTQGEKLFQ